MLIHVPTVCFILGALAFLFAVKMAADGLGRGESTKVLACWCFAFIFLAAASALMAVRPFGPSGARSVLPSFLLVVGFGLIWRGIAEFTGRRAPWILIAIGPLSFLVAWSQGIFSQDGHRLIFMSIVVSSYLIVSGRALFHGGGGLRSARLAGCVCFFHSGVQVLRIFTVLWMGSPTEPIGMAGFPAVLFIFEAVPVLVVFGYLLLNLSHERGEQMLLVASETDFLTGIANRRGFTGKARRVLADLEFPARQDVILICDLDHFKAANDAYGHSAGDEILALFCRVAEYHLTSADLIGRLGGEEFAILLRGNDLATAARRADAIRGQFEEMAAAMPLNPQGISVSIGLSSTEAGRDLDDLLRRADIALYQAKARGRNRVVSSGDPAEPGLAAVLPISPTPQTRGRSSQVAAV